MQRETVAMCQASTMAAELGLGAKSDSVEQRRNPATESGSGITSHRQQQRNRIASQRNHIASLCTASTSTSHLSRGRCALCCFKGHTELRGTELQGRTAARQSVDPSINWPWTLRCKHPKCFLQRLPRGQTKARSKSIGSSFSC